MGDGGAPMRSSHDVAGEVCLCKISLQSSFSLLLHYYGQRLRPDRGLINAISHKCPTNM